MTNKICKSAVVTTTVFAFLTGASYATPLDEIIVTAQKRETNLQSTPIAITAFGANQLEDRGINGAEDLQYYVPGLTFGKTVTRTSQVTLRGIGAENINPGGDPGVAVHVDGAYQQYSGYIAQDFFDVERVEVLRGPQGTLYGRNATGGSINIITKKPTEELEGSIGMAIGNYNQNKFQGVISGTLVENKILGRLSIESNSHDGFTKNIAKNIDIDDKDFTALRGQLEFQLSDSLTANLTVYGYQDDSTGVPLVNVGPNPSGPLLAGLNLDAANNDLPDLIFANFFVSNNALPNPTILDRRLVSHNTDTIGSEESDGATLILNKDFDGFSIKSTTSYNDVEYLNAGDTDSTAEVSTSQTTAGNYETISQELQVSSTSDGSLKWTAGIYYYKEESAFDANITLADTTPLAAPFIGVPVTWDALGQVDAKSFAVYGEGNYRFSDALSVTFGLRYTDDKKDMSESVFAMGLGVLDPVTLGPVLSSDSAEFSETTSKLGLEYTTNNTLFYGTVSTGFKAGGFNISGLQPSYDPETVTAIEAGFKSSLASDSVRLNGAVFYYDYEDLQAFQIEGQSSVITNATSAEVSGIELELVSVISESLTIDTAINYLDATYKEFITEDALFPGISRDLAGNTLPRAPKLSLNIGLQYSKDMGESGSLRGRLNYSWTDDQYFRQFNLDRDREESYSRTDLTLSWASADDIWDVDAFVKNIEDDDTISNIIVAAGVLGSQPLASFNPPRTIGLGVQYNF